jgi:hypothetical protein
VPEVLQCAEHLAESDAAGVVAVERFESIEEHCFLSDVIGQRHAAAAAAPLPRHRLRRRKRFHFGWR